MLCENCHQNEASIHYTEIINGVKKEHHICMDCARRLNFAGMSDNSDSEFPFVRLLTGLLAGNSAQVEDGPMMHIRCPGCGMTFDEFTMVGKFGCAECYGVFGPLIEDNMKRLHGDSVHKGKKYKKYKDQAHDNDESDVLQVMKAENAEKSVEERIRELNMKLREAVEIENFEEAARLRDMIKKLKKEDATQGGSHDA